MRSRSLGRRRGYEKFLGSGLESDYFGLEGVEDILLFFVWVRGEMALRLGEGIGKVWLLFVFGGW